MALVTLQTIFQDAFPAYEQTHPLPRRTSAKAARGAIIQCRTAALGGHIQACPDGHMSRHLVQLLVTTGRVPKARILQTERWLALQRARRLACDHYHVILTLPHERNPLWLANRAGDDLVAVSDRAGHPLYLTGSPQVSGRAPPGSSRRCTRGVRPCCCLPHLHGLVTGGGADPGRAVGGRAETAFLLPARGGDGRFFRGKMVDAIRQTCARGGVRPA